MTEDHKEIFKQAIREWLDEKYAEVGRWTIRSLITAGVGLLLYNYIAVRGWKFP